MAISYLIRLAMTGTALTSIEQTLAWCPDAGDRPLKVLQELLVKEGSSVSMRSTLRGDRAILLHLFELVDRGESGFDEKTPSRWDFSMEYSRQYMPSNMAFVHERFDEFLALYALPVSQKASAIRRWQLPRKTKETAFGFLLFPAESKVAEAEIRYRAKCLCTSAGIACERYRLKHGKWPEKLDDLTQFGIEPKALIDSFNGEPIRYLPVEDGAVHGVQRLAQRGALGGIELRRYHHLAADQRGHLGAPRPMDPGSR